MKVSARNVLPGRVHALAIGDVNAEVTVELEGGQRLAAVITARSARELELAAGAPVLALAKAPWVMLRRDAQGARRPAGNGLAGRVKSVAIGLVNAEVVLELPGGSELAAVLTKEAARELGLAPGVPATAFIAPAQIVIGVLHSGRDGT